MGWLGIAKYGLLLIAIGFGWLVERWIYRKGYKKGYALGKKETEEKYHQMASDIHKRLADPADNGYKLRDENKTSFRLP